MHDGKHGHAAGNSTWCWHKHLPGHGAAHHHAPHHHAISTAHHASAAHAHHVPTCAVPTPHTVGTTATPPAPGPAGFPITSKALISLTLCCCLSCAPATSQQGSPPERHASTLKETCQPLQWTEWPHPGARLSGQLRPSLEPALRTAQSDDSNNMGCYEHPLSEACYISCTSNGQMPYRMDGGLHQGIMPLGLGFGSARGSEKRGSCLHGCLKVQPKDWQRARQSATESHSELSAWLPEGCC